MSFNELKERGTVDFPVALYCVDKNHTKYEMVSHWHNEFEIVRVIKGELQIRLNNNMFTAKAGDIAFVNPETVHAATPDNCVYECLVFYLDFLCGGCEGCRFFFEGLMDNEYEVKTHIEKGDTDIHKITDEIFETMKMRSRGYKFKVIGNLYRLFGEIIDNGYYENVSMLSEPTNDKNVLKLKKVLSYMRDNYDKQITLNSMAESVGMSPKYFCYFFKEMTRKTPVEYLNTYRIEKASRKLISSSKSVTDIAYSCGFNDLSYFIKTFKDYKGVTPAKFRKGE